MTRAPLAVLDLVPISSGSTAAQALRNSIDLAQARSGSATPATGSPSTTSIPGWPVPPRPSCSALTAAATSTIRIGSGAVQMGHRTALSVVEEFGLIDALHPGRLDLGLGRSAGRPKQGEGQGPGAAGHRRPDATGARTGCSSPSGSPSGTCSARRASRCRRRCCSCRARSRRTTPSRSATSSPCSAAATARPTGWRRMPSPAKAPTSRCGSWAAAAARAPRWPARTGCGSRPTTTSARPPCWRRPRATGPPSGPPPISTGPTSASRPTSWWPGRGRGPGTRRRLRPVGPQHPLRRGRDPVPDPGAGPGLPVDRRGPGPGRRPGRDPVRRVPEAGRRPARAAPGGDRRRRADHHHHHPRPCRPGPLLPAPGRGMAAALKGQSASVRVTGTGLANRSSTGQC